MRAKLPDTSEAKYDKKFLGTSGAKYENNMTFNLSFLLNSC